MRTNHIAGDLSLESGQEVLYVSGVRFYLRCGVSKRKHITIRDIARESGASLTTVSLVLNNRDGRISEATRTRVRETVSRLGYRPNRLAQGLQSQRAGILAILVPELQHAFADAYIGELISAIHDRASQAGHKILLEVAHPEFIERGQHRELFDRHFVDGILCIGVTNNDSYLADFEDSVGPMVVVNNYIPGLSLNSVRCDYRAAGKLAGQHLLGLGHRRIGLIHGAPEVQTSNDLRKGFEESLSASGASLPEYRIADGKFLEEGGAEAAFQILKRDSSVTAFLCGNDKMAIGAVNALVHAGRRVPLDLSVIGCDDLKQSTFCNPRLTTVRTPLYDLGTRACEALLDLVEGKVDRVNEIRPVELVARESTGRVRGD